MQKIIIVADGIVAKTFLQKIAQSWPHEYRYEIVYFNDEILPSFLPDEFILHRFDATSRHKLSRIVTVDTIMVFVLLQESEETKLVLENIRSINTSVQIVALNGWDLRAFCERLKAKTVDVNEILANTFVHFLPSVPLIAQNIGLGSGEIMEVLVPHGSKYVFRHISNIEQKNWKIAALYRNSQLILPRQNTIIRPGDELLLIGQPNILRDIFKSIKSELGQFPMPFGTNIYLFLDMSVQKLSDIKATCEEALWLHKLLKNRKLIIKAVNIRDPKAISLLRALEKERVIVDMHFGRGDIAKLLTQDTKRFGVGLIIADRDVFSKYVKTLFETKKPVLKLSKKPLSKTQRSLVLLEKSDYPEKISSLVFDLSMQLDLEIMLADFDPDGIKKDETIEHYRSLSAVYSKKIALETAQRNPYREIKKWDDFLQFLPFEPSVANRSLKRFFAANIAGLYGQAADYPQLFIPIND